MSSQYGSQRVLVLTDKDLDMDDLFTDTNEISTDTDGTYTDIEKHLPDNATIRPNQGGGNHRFFQGRVDLSSHNLENLTSEISHTDSMALRKEQGRNTSTATHIGSWSYDCQNPAQLSSPAITDLEKTNGFSSLSNTPSKDLLRTDLLESPNSTAADTVQLLNPARQRSYQYLTSLKIEDDSSEQPATMLRELMGLPRESVTYEGAFLQQNGTPTNIFKSGIPSPEVNIPVGAAPSDTIPFQIYRENRRGTLDRDDYVVNLRPQPPASDKSRYAQPLSHVVSEPSDNIRRNQAVPLSEKYDDLREFLGDLKKGTARLLHIIRGPNGLIQSRGNGQDPSDHGAGGPSGGFNSGFSNGRQKRGADSQGIHHGQQGSENSGFGDDGAGKRQKRRNGKDRENDKKNLPCPFQVRDPEKFDECGHFEFMSRVDKHLAGTHGVYVCNMCLTGGFKEKQEVIVHKQKHAQACSNTSCSRHLPPDAILLETCDCLRTAERHWLGVYHYIFPGDSVPFVFGHRADAFPKTLTEMLEYSENMLRNWSSEHDAGCQLGNATLQVDPLASMPPNAIPQSNGPCTGSNQAETYGDQSNQSAFVQLQTQGLGLYREIEEFERSLDTAQGSKSDYRRNSKKDKRLERRYQRAKKKLAHANALLEMVLRRLKESKHRNDTDYEDLVRVVQSHLEACDGSTTSSSSCNEPTASSNAEAGKASSPASSLSDWRKDIHADSPEKDPDLELGHTSEQVSFSEPWM